MRCKYSLVNVPAWLLAAAIACGGAGSAAASDPAIIGMEGGRGLLAVPAARTFGRGMIAFGLTGLGFKSAAPVSDSADFPSVLAFPASFGLTDEIDIGIALTAFHDARPMTAEGTAAPETGYGAVRMDIKIRMPLSMESRLQVAGSFGAAFDTATSQSGAMIYPWTHKGTDISASLHESYDLTRHIGIYLSQGYILSGTKAYDDQVTAGAALTVSPGDRLTLSFEVSRRTFLGTGPWSAAEDGPDNTVDVMEDYLFFTPGLHYRLNEHAAVSLGAHIDLADHPGNTDNLMAVGGLTFTAFIPAMRDIDGDGISDAVDLERRTPRGYPVDAYGRALDTDGDGVPDGIDIEPNTPAGALVDMAGIALDSDGDGVPDGLDREPGTHPGDPVNEFGVALDDDGDGVPNGRDIELETPVGALVDASGAALDGDGDGVPDGLDREPDTAPRVAVDRYGVRFDDDGDGVPNDIDREPDTPAGVLVDKRGRALVREEYVLLREGLIRFDSIYFPPESVEVPTEAFTVLEDMGRIMLKYPTLDIQIEGHSDATGDDARNMLLARERARNVLDCILDLVPDLDRRRFRVVGFGADKPLAPNETLAGRQMNRRVDFVVINHDLPDLRN